MGEAGSPGYGRPFPSVRGYAIEDVLGEGGMGVVYRARELETKQAVALKMLKRTDPTGIYRLKREFRTLADVVHPNLVRLHELRCEDSVWFFTMDLIAGRSFHQFLKFDRWSAVPPPSGVTETIDVISETSGPRAARRPDSLDETRLRRCFVQLARGVAAIHQAGKVHCDIKPSNLMVTEDERLVVLDFGISSSFGQDDPFATRDGWNAGTPLYMSPEQAAGEALGPASDWYAVGTVLYEVLTGALPFSGATPFVIARKRSETPPRPSALRPDVPADLDALCMDLLAHEASRRPTGEQVIARLESPAATRRSPSSGLERAPVPGERANAWIGRAMELAWLRAAANHVQASRPVVALVMGASGIGKSELVHAFGRELRADAGVLVLGGRCYESESVPNKAIDPLIDELSRFLRRLSDQEAAELLPRDIRALARVFPVLDRVPAIQTASGRPAEGDLAEVRRRASRALKELLDRLADRWRVVLIVDDAQWGDVDSARLLLEALEPPDTPGVLVILAARDVDPERSPMLRALLDAKEGAIVAPFVRRLQVTAMDRDEASRLAATFLGHEATDELSAAVAEESGGNPFFVRELALHARGGDGQKPEVGSRLRLESILRERIEALPRDLRAMLELVAVSGQPVSEATIGRLSASGSPSASQWTALSDAHLIRLAGAASDRSVECFHDRVREVAIAAMPPERTSECHGLLAGALEKSGDADPEVLLEHYRLAGDLDSARKHVLASADAARSALAFSRAARLYQMSLDLVPVEQWARLELERRLAEALALDGRLRQAAAAYSAAAERAEGLEAITLRRLSAQHFLTSGDRERGLEVLERVMRDVGLKYPSTPTLALGRLAWARAKLRVGGLRFEERVAAEVPPLDLARADVCFSAAAGLSMNDLARTAAFSAEHLVLALRTGEPTRIARGLAFEMGVAPGAGAEGLRWADRALPVAERLSERHDDSYHRGLFFLAQGYVAYLSGQWKAAVDWLLRAEIDLRSPQATDVQWALLSCNMLTLNACAVSGDLQTVETRLHVLMKEARQRDDLHGPSLFVYPSVVLHLSRDRVDAARALLHETARDQPADAFDLRDFTALHCALLVDRYVGQPRAAWRRLEEKWPAITRSKILVVNVVRTALLAERGTAALAMATGRDAAHHLRVAKDCAKQLLQDKLPYSRALGRVMQGRIHRVLGDGPRALSTLTDASVDLHFVGLAGQALCARRALGCMKGGNVGRVLVEEMDAALRKEGVVDPARFAELMIPGFATSLPG